MDKIFRSDLVWLDEQFAARTSFFEAIGQRLYEKGLVKESFGQALAAREADFPTGLKTEFCETAIPHTDVEHVENASISFVRFCRPVEFLHMGMPEIKVNASFAFVLGVKEPQKQVEVLSTLVALISDKAAMEQLESMTSEQEICDMLNEFFEANMGGL